MEYILQGRAVLGAGPTQNTIIAERVFDGELVEVEVIREDAAFLVRSLLDLRHPVDELRISVNRNDDLHETASNAVTAHKHRATRRKTVPRTKAPIYLAVHRFDDTVYYRRLEPEAFRILTSLRRGDSIRKAIENGFERSALPEDDYQAGIAQWFATWAELGWLCRAPL